MVEPTKINKISSSQEERIKGIYNSYIKDITPFIVSIETFDNEYPVEIINEIRAIFTHISRCYSFPDVDIDAQIVAAGRHVKRCRLDGYKYFCVSFIDYIKRFYHDYQNVDLTCVNNGHFIKELKSKCKAAQDKIKLAKKIDTQNYVTNDDLYIKQDSPDFKNYCRAICDDDLFNYYEEAYKAYADCVSFIDENIDNIEYFKHKANKKDIATVISLILGVLGVIVGVLGMTGFKF